MHTTNVLRSTDFSCRLNNRNALLEDIFPAFDGQDRIGIIVRQPGGSAGASDLLMAAVTRFYDFHREALTENANGFRIYPDYFIFHVEKRHMNHASLDVWPPHKEVVVEDDPEQILEAVNDRGITRLLVEDIPPSPATFLKETVSSANHRIVSAMAYSPHGQTGKSNVEIAGSPAVENYVSAALQKTPELSEEVSSGIIQRRHSLMIGGRVTEAYRQLDVSEALLMLTTGASRDIAVKKRLAGLPDDYFIRLTE